MNDRCVSRQSRPDETSDRHAKPDQPRLAVSGDGRGVIVWEDSTDVRRRILARMINGGGRTLGPVRVLSQALKAWTPDVAVAPDGALWLIQDANPGGVFRVVPKK